MDPAKAWDRFIAHLNEAHPLGRYGDGTHKSFLGSIEMYRKLFMEANTPKGDARMKDILGQGLAEGDEVIFNPPHYKGIVLGTIVNFTEKMVRVKFEPTGYQRFDEVLVLPQNVMKRAA